MPKKTSPLIVFFIILAILLFLGGMVYVIINLIQQTALAKTPSHSIAEDFNDQIYKGVMHSNTEIILYEHPEIDVYGIDYITRNPNSINAWTGETASINFILDKYGTDVPYAKIYRCGEGCGVAYTQEPDFSNGKLILHSGISSSGIDGERFILFIDLTGADIVIHYELSPSGGNTITLTTNFGGTDASSDMRKGTIKIRRSFLDANIVFVEVAGVDVGQLDVRDKKYLVLTAGGRGLVLIDEIDYKKPVSSCAVSETETVYLDKFTKEGTEIKWIEPRTLAYEPLRFCDDLHSKRILLGVGVAPEDENNELTRKLAMGETYIVEAGEEIWVFYVIPFVEGETYRCGVGEAWSTKDNMCVRTAIEEQITIQCKTDDDCPYPPSCEESANKPYCDENNMCAGYESVECKEEVLVIQKRYIAIRDFIDKAWTINSFVYTKNYETTYSPMIGQKTISISSPEFKCDKDSFSQNHGYVTDEKCYYVTVTGLGESVSIQSGLTKALNKYIDVSCFVGGRGVFFGEHDGQMVGGSYIRESHWDIGCVFTIDNSFLTLKAQDNPLQILINTKPEFKYDIHNDLTDFTGKTSGVTRECQKTFGLIGSFQTEVIEKDLNMGKNTITLLPESSENAKYVCDIGAYVVMRGDNEFRVPNAKPDILEGYNVVFEIIDPIKTCRELGCDEGFTCDKNTGNCILTIYVDKDCKTKGCMEGYTCNEELGVCEITKIPVLVWIIPSIIILAVIIFAIFLLKKKNKKRKKK